MDSEVYSNALNADGDEALIFFKKLKTKGVYTFLNAIFRLFQDHLTYTAQENLKKVIQDSAPTFPQDHLEKFYENGSATEAFPVFEMFVDAGYHTSWQWSSEDLFWTCCVSGSPKYLPKFLARQNITQKDVGLLIVASFNPNIEVFEKLLSHFDVQEAFNSVDQLINSKQSMVSFGWRQFNESVGYHHIEKLHQDLWERLCFVQREKICEEVCALSSTVVRKKM